MVLTLSNFTDTLISCRYAGRLGTVDHQPLFLYPSVSQSTLFHTRRRSVKLVLSLLESENGDNYGLKRWPIKQENFFIRVPLKRAIPQVIPVPESCPWRIYLTRVTRKHHRLLIIPKRSLSSFLSEMPDNMPLSALCLPGTHDSMAFYGWPISQCQEPSTPLSTQLQSGIRVLDIRLAIVDSQLIAYHGIYPQRTPFQHMLSAIYAFLTDPSTCRETIVVSIKQEDFAKNSYLDFSRLVHEEMFNGPGGSEMWYLQNRIPLLGEVRGRVVLFSRFGGDGEGWEDGWEGLGIHPLVWPDNEKGGFSWQCKDMLVQTQDWYGLPSFLSIPEKLSVATQILLPPPNDPPMPTLAITFLSASSFPFALPPIIAKGFGWPKIGLGVEGINSRFTQFLVDLLTKEDTAPTSDDEKVGTSDDGPRVRGWVLLDYYVEPGVDLVPLLVECNYRGRRAGEEGW